MFAALGANVYPKTINTAPATLWCDCVVSKMFLDCLILLSPFDSIRG